MPAGSTYEPIATTTLTGTATTIDFTSIPNTYTDLVLIISAATNSGDNIFYRFNSNTSAIYSTTFLYGTGSSALSTRRTSQTTGRFTVYGFPSTTAGEQMTICNIFNYANTTTYKTVLSRSGRGNSGLEAEAGLFASTSAISSISLAPDGFSGSFSFTAGTTATLYGITAA